MVYGIFLTLILDLIFWSRTHPHNYFDFAPEVAKSIFVVAHPSVPFGFAHFTPRSGACSPHFFFFFFQPRRGCPMGSYGPHWLYKPEGLVHRTPLGSGIKIPFGDFYNVTLNARTRVHVYVCVA